MANETGEREALSMRVRIAQVVAGIVAGAGAVAADVGLELWSGLVAVGLLADPQCNDVVTSDTVPSAVGACAAPSSLMWVAAIATVTVSLVAVFGVRALAGGFRLK